MNKLILILFSILSLTAFAQEKIALLEPRVGDSSNIVTPMEKNMIRGELRKAIVNYPGYEAITRSDIDQMMKEQTFQRTGLVSATQIKKLSEMAAADYICVSTISKSNTEFYLEAYLVHLESGRMLSPASQYGELSNGKLANLFPACQELAKELLGDNSIVRSELNLPEGKYVGEIRNGKPHGQGKLIYKDFEGYYDGEWKNGMRHGYGIIEGNGEKYEGNFKNGNFSGHGTYSFNNGDKYEGDFEKGMYNGTGMFYFASGDKYIGNFSNNEMYGQGIYYFANGNRYEGHFENGWINGYGTGYYADGMKHVGYFKDGNRHGKGTTYFDGGRFEGNFSDEKAEGIGTFYYSIDNSIEKGNFVNGQRDGEWIKIDSNEIKKTAIYSNGELISDWH